MRFFSLNRVYNFMRAAPFCAVASLLVTIGTVVALFYPGPNLGTDFVGGTEIEVAFNGPVEADKVRGALETIGLHDSDVVEVRTGTNTGGIVDRYIIRVSEVSTISDETQRQAEQKLCLAPASETADCPASRHATEVKFSPGGDRITARFVQAPDMDWVRERLSSVGGLQVRPGADNPRVDPRHADKVIVELLGTGDMMFNALRAQIGKELLPEAPLRVEWVGPKAGAQLRNAALQSIAITLVAIMAYVAVRFDLRYAPGAVLCLVHDALVATGALMVAGKEMNLTVIAALLTIIGFSVNDTVVIYDRVRENMRRLRGASFPEIINLSVSEMLGRTVITSGTAILSLVPFLVWGTNALQDFAYTLIVGMICGVYSTVFVALPLTHWLDRLIVTRRKPTGARRVVARPKRELNPL
ncbi:MAG TPA: protein translocase subunit SecF [Polyangiaceae bacterium]|nr:protein translocase subunit SecF [Polyangiaceae bacterium]